MESDKVTRMHEWRDYKLTTAADVLAAIMESSKNYSLIYRGQGSSNWGLAPSIQRLFPVGFDRKEMATWEAAAISNFRRHARAYLPEPHAQYLRTVLGTLTLMQHYGAPTRILDWTTSPWVAAYFAATSSPKENGVIWAFDRDFMSRNTRWGITGAQEEIQRFLDEFDLLTGATTVIDWVKYSPRDIPAFTTFIYEFADQRISAQQSLFTLAGVLGIDHKDHLARLLPDDKRYRIVIPSGIKNELVHLLWRMNIGPLSLFPGIDGVGRFVTDAIHNHLAMDDGGIGWILRETNDGRDLGLS